MGFHWLQLNRSNRMQKKQTFEMTQKKRSWYCYRHAFFFTFIWTRGHQKKHKIFSLVLFPFLYPFNLFKLPCHLLVWCHSSVSALPKISSPFKKQDACIFCIFINLSKVLLSLLALIHSFLWAKKIENLFFDLSSSSCIWKKN